jgi:hypothetical protein
VREARGRTNVGVAVGRLLLAGALGLASVVALALPASAHDSVANFRTRLTSVTPALPGLHLTAPVDGSFLRVRNTSATPVVVLGYEHEPYLRISSAGVWRNDRSPATYLNDEGSIGEVPADADPHAAPEWTKVSARPVARFHDHRIHWMGNGRPAVVDRDPASAHLLKRWTVTLVASDTTVTVAGTLRWEPGSAWSRLLGYGFVLVGLGGAAAVCAALWRRQRRLAGPATDAEPAGVPARV